MSSDPSSSWEINATILAIKALIPQFNSVVFFLVKRSANRAADNVAKASLSGNIDCNSIRAVPHLSFFTIALQVQAFASFPQLRHSN